MDGGHLATLTLGDSVTRLPGVGAKRAEDFRKLGVETIGDLLTLWPRRYIDRTRITPIGELRPGATSTVEVTIQSVAERMLARGQKVTSLSVSDGTGRLDVTFFHAGWIKRHLRPGVRLLMTGRVEVFRHQLAMTHPEFAVLTGAERPRLGLWPIYPLAGELKQRFVQELEAQVVPMWAAKLDDPLPLAIRQQRQLRDRASSVEHLHFPQDVGDRESARRRLVFDEFLRVSLAVLWLNQRSGGRQAPVLDAKNALVQRLLSALPFSLTPGQQAAWADIAHDLTQEKPMARLLQGDVGSGKTLVALLAMLAAVGSGYQAALMAPTELLAEQHQESLANWLSPLGVPVGLIRAGQSDERVASGEPMVVVGTHALISERVTFDRLGVVVVDEQHRFGVRQRARLSEKGTAPHMLVMTATPIPRTLALTVYGDLAISRMGDKPPGRWPVTTVHLRGRDRRQAYVAVQQAVRQGRQAYVICPLVGDTEEVNGKAAQQLAEGMRTLPGWRVGLIHGRLPSHEKAKVMEDFRRGSIDVLVGTTILEVGIDVPNATVIVIEEADRFGLAQLHQLRGRVGRGPAPATCYLIADPTTPEAEARLEAMVMTQDGYELAERDLAIRGPGEVLGMRQHGLAGFQLADPIGDLALLEDARVVARQILADDPTLDHDDHRILKAWVHEMLGSEWPTSVLH